VELDEVMVARHASMSVQECRSAEASHDGLSVSSAVAMLQSHTQGHKTLMTPQLWT